MKKLTAEQVSFIRTQHTKITIAEMCDKLNLSYPTIKGFCDRYGLKPVKEHELKKIKRKFNSDELWYQKKKIIGFRPEPASRPFERPKTEYTNSPSPYGIADELFNRKLTKQCKY